MPYAELADARLYYERAGSGEPELLFVPGWCCDQTAFAPQFDHFAGTLRIRGGARRAGRGGDPPRYVHDMRARDEELGRWIVDLMCAVPQRVAAAVIRGVSEWNGREPFTRCQLPVLLLRSKLGEDPDALRLRAIKPDLELGITVGAGHFHQIEVPEQVNAMIDRFLALSLPSAAA